MQKTKARLPLIVVKGKGKRVKGQKGEMAKGQKGKRTKGQKGKRAKGQKGKRLKEKKTKNNFSSIECFHTFKHEYIRSTVDRARFLRPWEPRPHRLLFLSGSS